MASCRFTRSVTVAVTVETSWERFESGAVGGAQQQQLRMRRTRGAFQFPSCIPSKMPRPFKIKLIEAHTHDRQSRGTFFHGRKQGKNKIEIEKEKWR